jgi:hypothetical protein
VNFAKVGLPACALNGMGFFLWKLSGASINRRERFKGKADGAQKPERTEVREDFEHRPTQPLDRATDYRSA